MSILHDVQRIVAVAVLVTMGTVACGCSSSSSMRKPDLSVPDVLIVGCGAAGLATALEAAAHGANVLVVDQWSVFGGHAVMANAGLLFVGTPLQRDNGIDDDPAKARADFASYGEDVDAGWVDAYVSHSTELYEWLGALGVRFDQITKLPGNSVPRFHVVKDRGFGLVAPMYRAALENPKIKFRFNTRVVQLIKDGGRIGGVKVVDMRTGASEQLDARAVVIATGGFQSNLQLVRKHWPKDWPVPSTLLVGSGLNAVGSGLDLAKAVDAGLRHLDRMWVYATGTQDPRYPAGSPYGMRMFNRAGIWLNDEGKRFVNETAGERVALQALLRQRGFRYWVVFDAPALSSLVVRGPEWTKERVDQMIVNNPRVLFRADTIADLARQIGLPAADAERSIRRYNALVDKQIDDDLQRFTRESFEEPFGRDGPPKKIATAPFYAYVSYAITRKSMGGIAIDHRCRVLDIAGNVIPGLFAAGEVTGLGGINGVAALEGTFLGPGILMGRVAGAAAARTAGDQQPALLGTAARPILDVPPTTPAIADDLCLRCHPLDALVDQRRRGFQHFELVHRVVRSEETRCSRCHGELSSDGRPPHRIDRDHQLSACRGCH